MQANLCQSRIFVQGFEHNCLDLFAKEIVTQADLANSLVTLKGIDNKDDSWVIESAGAEVELLELRSTVAIAFDHLGKHF